MTQRCKCEHWQDCPTCAPQRFDADGKRKPPEPTPLQACRAELETMREALALHEVGSAYAHRLAVMLECALLDPTGTWNEAHALLDEYRAACRAAAPMQEPPTFMGEPVVMPNALAQRPVEAEGRNGSGGATGCAATEWREKE